MKYDREHKESLARSPEQRERMQSLLQNGEKITPKHQTDKKRSGGRKKFNVNFIVKTGAFLYN